MHLGKGQRRRGRISSAENPSQSKEKIDESNILFQSDMVKYMMNDILCGKNEEGLGASLAGMEKACQTVREALEQKAMIDGHDSVSMDFMKSMWSTVQYCMVRSLIDR